MKTKLGTVSHGTTRNEDLIPAFCDELKYYHKRLPAGIGKRMKKRNYYKSDDAEYDLEELFDLLNAIAPPWSYFGAHPGDGSDYGFWVDIDSIDSDFDGPKVEDLSDVPVGYSGEVLHVNDHGNMTLYHKGRNGKFYELWSIV